MQSNETEPKMRSNLHMLVQYLWESDLPRLDHEETRELTKAELHRVLVAATTAERDRADRAEARLAEAWDEGVDATFYDPDSRGNISWGDNPYRSEATA